MPTRHRLKAYHVLGGSAAIHLQHQAGWSSHPSLPQLSDWGQIWVLLCLREDDVPCEVRKKYEQVKVIPEEEKFGEHILRTTSDNFDENYVFLSPNYLQYHM